MLFPWHDLIPLHLHGLILLSRVQACASGSLSTGAILGVAVPLMQQVIVEGAQSCSLLQAYLP